MEGEQKDHENLPPGFRFHPSDEELITYYLVNKISDSSFTARAIGDVDLNKCEPWDLPGKAKMGEKEWYFFCLRDRKYPTGVRTNRATNTGYWKTTGKDKEIFNSTTSELIGMKKTLVFYRGRAPRGEKTNWVMHEYRIHSKSSYRAAKDEWVVCRVFQKSGIKKYPSSQSSRSINLGVSNVTGPPLIPVDPVQFPNMGSRNYMMANMDLPDLSRNLRTMGSNSVTMPFGPQVNYPGGCFTMSGLNLNLGGVGTSVASQQAMFRAPQQEMNSTMLTNSTLAMETAGFGVVDVNAAAGVPGRFPTNMENINCMEFDGYWPHYT